MDGGFACSLCGKGTGFGSQVALRQRYLNPAMARELLPELACSVYEVDCGGDGEETASSLSSSSSSADASAAAAAGGDGGGTGAPVYLAVVDTAADEEFVDLVGL